MNVIQLRRAQRSFYFWLGFGAGALVIGGLQQAIRWYVRQ